MLNVPRSGAVRRGICLPALVAALAALAWTESARAADGDDRLRVRAFVGEVNNNFSAEARLAATGEDQSGKSNLDLAAGIDFDYRLRGEDKQRFKIYLFGETIHSARTLQAQCAPGGTGCVQTEGDPQAPKPGDFFKIVNDSNTLEWLGGVRAAWGTNGAGAGKYETELYVKAQAGFIRARAAADDVVDNHFVGVGIEHVTGVFRRSHLEAGWGRSDLFGREKRYDRAKVAAVLEYTPLLADKKKTAAGEAAGTNEAPILSFFAKGLFDSDLGPGSDDVQIYFGVRFDIPAMIDRWQAKK